MDFVRRRRPAAGLALACGVVGAALLAGARLAAADPPEGSQSPGTAAPGADAEATPAPVDPTVTAGGALRLFMASRHYQTIRQLKGVMTEKLQARFDHDSAPFNGKRGNRLAAFDFTEKDLRPSKSAGQPGTATRYVASVRSLWEEQGEATEKRTETAVLSQQEGGVWRVADLSAADSEKLRFGEAVNGVTVLRQILRAWHGGNVAAARAQMSEAFLKKYQGREDALASLGAPAEGHKRAAYQIKEMTPQATTAAVARVLLYDTATGEPGRLDGREHTLKMIKKGQRWLLDAWD
jgi:hypothetical protein